MDSSSSRLQLVSASPSESVAASTDTLGPSGMRSFLEKRCWNPRAGRDAHLKSRKGALTWMPAGIRIRSENHFTVSGPAFPQMLSSVREAGRD